MNCLTKRLNSIFFGKDINLILLKNYKTNFLRVDNPHIENLFLGGAFSVRPLSIKIDAIPVQASEITFLPCPLSK